MEAVPMISCKSIWRLPMFWAPNLILICGLQVAYTWFHLVKQHTSCFYSPNFRKNFVQLLVHFANVAYRPTTPFCSWFELPLQPKRRCRKDIKKSQQPQPQPTLHPSTILCLLHLHFFLPHRLHHFSRHLLMVTQQPLYLIDSSNILLNALHHGLDENQCRRVFFVALGRS